MTVAGAVYMHSHQTDDESSRQAAITTRLLLKLVLCKAAVSISTAHIYCDGNRSTLHIQRLNRKAFSSLLWLCDCLHGILLHFVSGFFFLSS